MAIIYALDASVVLNAFLPRETDHEVSRGLLQRMMQQGVALVEPTLILVEVAATLGRGQHDAARAMRFVDALVRLPGLALVGLDGALARQAASLAARQRLRGADAVYAAVALRYGATLVTRDREQLERAATAVPVRTPAQASEELRAAG